MMVVPKRHLLNLFAASRYPEGGRIGRGAMDERHLVARYMGISTLWGIRDAAIDYVCIDLRNNCLRNFEHFGTHPNLVELRLQDNYLESFLGLTRQPSLAVIELRGNPIASHPWYRVMVLLVVGFSVTTIDGTIVSEEERGTARLMGPSAALAVSYGWLLHPGERTAEEYRRIIVECKEARRRGLLRRHNTFRTVAQALKPHTCADVVGSPMSDDPAIVRNLYPPPLDLLSTRMASFESASGEVGPSMHRGDTLDCGHAQGLTGDELRLSQCILFTDGICMRTNVVSPADGECSRKIRVSLMFEDSLLVFLTFVSRARLAELTLCSVVVEYHLHSVLRIQGGDGAAFDCFFEDVNVLLCVYKLLYLWRGISVPPLRLYNGEEVNATLQCVQAVETEHDGSESDSNCSNHAARGEKRRRRVIPLNEGTITTTSPSPEISHPLPLLPERVSPVGEIPRVKSPFVVAPSVRAGSQPALPLPENASQGATHRDFKAGLHHATSAVAVAAAATSQVDDLKRSEERRDRCDVSKSKTSSSRRQQRRRQQQQQQQQQPPPPPPSKVPRRRCTSACAPSVPRRLVLNSS